MKHRIKKPEDVIEFTFHEPDLRTSVGYLALSFVALTAATFALRIATDLASIVTSYLTVTISAASIAVAAYYWGRNHKVQDRIPQPVKRHRPSR